MVSNVLSVLPLAIGISALLAIALASYWFINKKIKKRHLEELRRIYENMSPTDPRYNTARALFVAAAISDAATGQDDSGGSSAGGGDSGDGSADT